MPKERAKNHTVRITESLWHAARAAADSQGETVTDVIRRALNTYVRRYGTGRSGGRSEQ